MKDLLALLCCGTVVAWVLFSLFYMMWALKHSCSSDPYYGELDQELEDRGL